MTSANETTVPLLPCAAVEETVEFLTALGFELTYRQTRPYLYLAFGRGGIQLHYSRPPEGHDPAAEGGGCLVFVDEVAPYHAEFKAGLKAHYGRVPSSGRPRITRYREGASRFTLVDPSGNSLIVIQRDEPMELEYGGSPALTGLARALDNARILVEFKNDDRAAFRALCSGYRRHAAGADAAVRAAAVAELTDLAGRLGEQEKLAALLA
ncbi:glyoxalase [Kitasatospora sp. NPDC096147]|uniref:glyoxalase n=1 Tax=Kitasatospora sp. NPDC096147 TaxID=3364093 RepID=UPI00382BBE56